MAWVRCLPFVQIAVSGKSCPGPGGQSAGVWSMCSGKGVMSMTCCTSGLKEQNLLRDCRGSSIWKEQQGTRSLLIFLLRPCSWTEVEGMASIGKSYKGSGIFRGKARLPSGQVGGGSV